jgi:hypothetical protein
MNEEEYRGTDRDGDDGGNRGGDSGLVQPPDADTYRGPYGEPIVAPRTDDPEGHPEYQPGHGDDIDLDKLTRAINAITQGNGDRPVVIPYVPGSIFDPNTNRIREHGRPLAHSWEATITDFLAIFDPGSGQSDHGPRDPS